MYKEKLKSPVSPIAALAAWIIFLCLFRLLWGIIPILFNFNGSVIIGQVVSYILTIIFGWILYSGFMTEFEVTLSGKKLIFEKHIAKKTVFMRSVAVENIKDIYISEKIRIKDCQNFTRPFQKENTVTVTFEDGGKTSAIKFRPSKELTDKLKKLSCKITED